MLTELHIRNIAIARRAVVEFGPGLNVITGETGAGKSILIDALGLVLGDRADGDMIRHGEEQAEIVAVFEPGKNHEVHAWLKENALDEDGECLLRRVIHRTRPSKGYINGRPAPMQMLRELGEQLVDIHGQHTHQSLLKSANQRHILDAYAGIDDEVTKLGRQYAEMHRLRERIDGISRDSAERAARLELLQFQVSELDDAAIGANEMTELEEEQRKLANASGLLEGIQTTVWDLYEADEGSASTLLGNAVNRLQHLAEYDAELGESAKLLVQAQIELEEAVNGIRAYQDRLEPDPERLQWVEQRMRMLLDLARKHRVEPEALPETLARLRGELDEFDNAGHSAEKLQKQLDELLAQYHVLAARVTQKRRAAGDELTRQVTAEIRKLGLGDGLLQCEIAVLDKPGSHGMDSVEFLVSANPGQPPAPLGKVASGGELSRISLAIQVVTARINQIPTQIFDEVDVGIGGAIAAIVGAQLRQLAANRQVICITHLAQVAANGQHHLQISKSTETGTHLQTLDGNQRIEELSRMIGGVKITEQTRAHARELLESAHGA